MMRLANQKDNISSILMTEAIPVTRVSIGGGWGVGGRCDLINQLPARVPSSVYCWGNLNDWSHCHLMAVLNYSYSLITLLWRRWWRRYSLLHIHSLSYYITPRPLYYYYTPATFPTPLCSLWSIVWLRQVGREQFETLKHSLLSVKLFKTPCLDGGVIL